MGLLRRGWFHCAVSSKKYRNNKRAWFSCVLKSCILHRITVNSLAGGQRGGHSMYHGVSRSFKDRLGSPCLPLALSRQGLLRTAVHSMLAGPEASRSPPTSVSHLKTGALGLHVCTTVCALLCVLGICTELFTFAWQVLHPLSHSPSPRWVCFIFI